MALAKKLLHTRYRVNDLEQTVAFYKNVLGLEEVPQVAARLGVGFS
jgi:catechol 2,3-dioxygenase-like lactoylglutathione lyase family enzyme